MQLAAIGMSIKDAKTHDYRELNRGADGLLFGQRFNGFYKRIESLWSKGKASGGETGIIPIAYNGEHLTFDLTPRESTTLPTVRFSTRGMDDSAALGHLDLFRRLYKKEASQWTERAVEKAHANAVSDLMKMDVSMLDKTDMSDERVEDYLTKAKRVAKEMGLDLTL
jgi:hypothetical protein